MWFLPFKCDEWHFPGYKGRYTLENVTRLFFGPITFKNVTFSGPFCDTSPFKCHVLLRPVLVTFIVSLPYFLSCYYTNVSLHLHPWWVTSECHSWRTHIVAYSHVNVTITIYFPCCHTNVHITFQFTLVTKHALLKPLLQILYLDHCLHRYFRMHVHCCRRRYQMDRLSYHVFFSYVSCLLSPRLFDFCFGTELIPPEAHGIV